MIQYDQFNTSRKNRNIQGSFSRKGSDMKNMISSIKLNTIKECFDMVLDGDKEDSRLAARQVRKLLYGARGSKNEFKDIKNIVNSAPGNYVMIPEAWRQVNFVSAISVIYYLHDRESQPDFLFPWFFQLLHHTNGTIRYAVVKMMSQELGPLTVHIRFPGDSSIMEDRLKPEKADSILYVLFANLNNLLYLLWEPKYNKYKYINSLPTSPYKSAQMIMAEMEDDCGREYIEKLKIKFV